MTLHGRSTATLGRRRSTVRQTRSSRSLPSPQGQGLGLYRGQRHGRGRRCGQRRRRQLPAKWPAPVTTYPKVRPVGARSDRINASGRTPVAPLGPPPPRPRRPAPPSPRTGRRRRARTRDRKHQVLPEPTPSRSRPQLRVRRLSLRPAPPCPRPAPPPENQCSRRPRPRRTHSCSCTPSARKAEWLASWSNDGRSPPRCCRPLMRAATASTPTRPAATPGSSAACSPRRRRGAHDRRLGERARSRLPVAPPVHRPSDARSAPFQPMLHEVLVFEGSTVLPDVDAVDIEGVGRVPWAAARPALRGALHELPVRPPGGWPASANKWRSCETWLRSTPTP
jgi:hypothetical protein